LRGVVILVGYSGDAASSAECPVDAPADGVALNRQLHPIRVIGTGVAATNSVNEFSLTP
jgi:hypothetical protein